MKNKKIIILIIVILLIIVTIVTIIRNTKKGKQNTTFENNIATSEIILQDIEFKNIRKEFNNGITTIRAEAYNNTKEQKSINVKIILKDNTGKELTSMIQSLEGITPEGKKILQTGIVGDYSNIDNIEFKVLSNSDVEIYND